VGQDVRFTVDTYVRKVNLFLGWCRRGEMGIVRAQPPKLSRRVFDVPSRDNWESRVSSETKIIVRLLAETGIRANECRRLSFTA
jgi:integrase